MLLELIVHAKAESFTLGATLENCLHMILFVTKKSIWDFFMHNDNKARQEQQAISEKMGQLQENIAQLLQERESMALAKDDQSTQSKLLQIQNDKLQQQIYRYNNYHFVILQKIKCLDTILSKLRVVYNRVDWLIGKVEAKDSKLPVEHLLLEMYTIHSASARMIAVIEQFQLENNQEEIEM